MSLVLSIDMGTSGCRSAAFDQELNLLAMARGDYPLSVRWNRTPIFGGKRSKVRYVK